MTFEGLASLASNAGLLLSLVVLYDALGVRRDREHALAWETATGVLIGGIAAALMTISWRFSPGVVFDTRSVALSLAGLFFGAVPAVVAALIAACVRVAIGGAGVFMGLGVISMATGVGVAWRHHRRRELGSITFGELYLFGVVVHLGMLACTALLPAGATVPILSAIAAPVMIIYPVATALVGWVLRSWHLRRACELAARELAATRERLAAIVDAAPVAVVAVDLEGRVTEWSPAAEKMFGWSRDETLGRLNPIVPEEDRSRSVEMTRHALEDGPLRGLELERLRKDGSAIRVRLSNAGIHDPSGAVIGVMAVIEDVTERSELEAQLRQAQKMEAIGRLAGGIAHDFNNLLQALLSSTQAIRLRGAHPEVEHYLEDVQVNLERGVSLARQLLLFSRQAPSRREVVDLGRLVADHVSMLRHLLPENVVMAVDAPASPAPVRADAGQLGQVLTNLVVNARDAMPRGGRLEISLSQCEGEVALEVRDTGDGIPAELIDRVFDPFFTTKPLGQGSGLGLAVVWGIVNEHGGRVEVESEPGSGSLFRILLPESRGANEAAVRASVAADPRPGRGERILVVEDERAAREGLTELLSALGFSVVAVANGGEADALPETPPFDLVLTDYLLPGANGLEVARSLGARWPGINVIVMSGYAPGFIGAELEAGNGVAFLQKPFDMATLARRLRTSLDA